MSFVEIFCLSLALAVDVFGVAFAYGLIIVRHRRRLALRLAGTCGIMQFMMPLPGYVCTAVIDSWISRFDYLLVFSVFLALGLNVIREAVTEENGAAPFKRRRRLSWKTVLTIGIATSIDAFVSGTMLYLTKTPLLPAAVVIGFVSFVTGLLGFNLIYCFKKVPEKYLQITAGLVLIALGFKNLLAHFM
ncbi:MAG: manganese efflux pump [Pseudomonadota bacterium]|nr:manganese efflux pump [Pseudomonadota bacterium]